MADGRRIEVVGAVVVRDGAVLCARRGPGGPTGGLWEFPGGKIEPGETPAQALAREIDEELGCVVRVGEHLTTTVHEYADSTVALATYRCELVGGEPQAGEHAELRWLAPADLPTLRWAPADVPTVDLLMIPPGRGS